MEGEFNEKKRERNEEESLRLVPLLVEAIFSSRPSVRKNKAGEEESTSSLQGPMHRGTNCRNERNEMMETCWVPVVYLSVRVMVANTYFKTKARDRYKGLTRRRHFEQVMWKLTGELRTKQVCRRDTWT